MAIRWDIWQPEHAHRQAQFVHAAQGTLRAWELLHYRTEYTEGNFAETHDGEKEIEIRIKFRT
jgi:hypothetical protein